MKRGQQKTKTSVITAIKNTILFCRKLEDEHIASVVDTLLAKYGQPFNSVELLIETAFNDDSIKFWNIDRDTLGKEYLSKLSLQPARFYIDIFWLLDELDFGREWGECLRILLLTGKLIVPTQNFYIAEINEKLNDSPKRLVIILNADTTSDDLIDNFAYIQKKQKNCMPQSKPYRVTSKSRRDYQVHLMRTPLFKRIGAAAILMEQMSDYEEILFKEKYKTTEVKLKKINEIRKDDHRTALRLKKSISPSEMIKLYFNDSPKNKSKYKRLVNNIRQIDKREKRDKILV